MTQHRIPSLEGDQVREQLRTESDGKAIKRLIAACEHLGGPPHARIEETYVWHEQTVYEWLNRLEERDSEDAPCDDEPAGRSPELSDHQFDKFATALQDSPEQAGHDEPA